MSERRAIDTELASVNHGCMGQTGKHFARVKVNSQGRIVIPAEMRCDLGIKPGDTVVVKIQDGRLAVETRDFIIARIHSRWAQVPPEVSVVDELLAERREEARRELEEMEAWRKTWEVRKSDER